MAINYGKQFEQRFKIDIQNSIKDCFVYRLPDQQSGYIGTSQNPCDFLFYKYPEFQLLELKSIQGNTFPMTNLKQFNRLNRIPPTKGLYKAVIIWYRDHDRIIYVPIETVSKMIADGKKSINITTIDKEDYEFIDIPSTKKKVFLTSDYSVILHTEVYLND